MLRPFPRGALLAFGLLAGAPGCRDTADVIYAGGPVVTLEPGAPRAEALATRGERILAVGTRAEIEALAGRGTRQVDLEGHALLPGFVAAGGELLAAGERGATSADLRPPPEGPAGDLLGLQQELVRFGSGLPPDAWLVGAGYDEGRLGGGRHPTAADLDLVASERPVVILNASTAVAVANHAALALAGVDAATPDPPGGAIEREPATGAPTGVLRGAAVALVLDQRPPASRQVQLDVAVRGARLAASQGVTTALEGAAEVAGLELLLAADDAGVLPVRVVVRPGLALARSLASGEVRVAQRRESRLSLGAVELDGEAPELGPLASEIRAAGMPLALRARSAAALDAALAALAAAQAAHPRDDDRPALIGVGVPRAEQLQAMERLRAIPVLSPLSDGADATPALAAKAASEQGLRFALDAAPLGPIHAAASAADGVGAEAALRAVALDAAYALSLEQDRGSLAAGKLADLVILSQDPLDAPAAALADIEVLRTVVGGAPVYVK